MTKLQFQQQFGGDYKFFLDSPCGKAFFQTLSNCKILCEFPSQDHLLSENRGAVRGYDTCLKTIVGLSEPLKPHTEVEANYGVSTKKEVK